jgi:hypothetical protein
MEDGILLATSITWYLILDDRSMGPSVSMVAWIGFGGILFLS